MRTDPEADIDTFCLSFTSKVWHGANKEPNIREDYLHDTVCKPYTHTVYYHCPLLMFRHQDLTLLCFRCKLPHRSQLLSGLYGEPFFSGKKCITLTVSVNVL